MKIRETSLNGVVLIEPVKFGDHRGYFSETFNKKEFEKITKDTFVQDNQSLSAKKNTLRGLHFQTKPYAQDKLVRVLKGSILDIVVDLRKSSSTFLKHEIFEISDENFLQIWVPKGFAHGVLTLEENTVLSYKVTNFYSKENDSGISIFDENLKIKLPVSNNNMILSDKDKNLEKFDIKKHSF
jgi:dTDP-4-dehydrorhamnose 3,5-epimerase